MDSDIEFLYIGWCVVKSEYGTNSDKVWTAFKAGGSYYAGWGARGKTIRFKQHPNRESVEKVMKQKQKGYDEVDAFQLFTIFPTFEDDVSSKLLIAMLTDKVI